MIDNVKIETKVDLMKAVLECLRSGKDNALQGTTLARLLGERSTRQIRLAINSLIERGYPICSTAKPPYGYFIAENAEECQECLNQLRSYLKMLGHHHKHLLRASRTLINPYQTEMQL